ncbi:MAG TPA: M14 family metallopeptidase [Rhizomicrobium sp.]|jgi:hypothetical protein|nr:M14 family metallopeptidase [Rhizomicrobium sp.]
MAKPQTYFPADYRKARAAFLQACEAADLGVTSRLLPNVTGPDGKGLFLDAAVIGEHEAKDALLLISGTHGVEGYFGSGVQTGLLREGLAKRVKAGAKIVLLHALNPFGFAWNRRVNEDNADVNRNFVDHKRPPKNAAYDKLADAIAPAAITREAFRKANAKLIAYSSKHGAFKLQEAISAGQYGHPKGLYFGGARESWSALMLKDVLKEHLSHAKTLTVIDFHTGLGDCGAAEMITEDLPKSAAYKRARELWGALVQSSEAGESVSAPLTGTIDNAVVKWMKGKELTFAALEVGTAPIREVFDALRKDNWLHAFAKPGAAQTKSIKQEIRAAFYPDTADWKRKVWDHGAQSVERALAAIA